MSLCATKFALPRYLGFLCLVGAIIFWSYLAYGEIYLPLAVILTIVVISSILLGDLLISKFLRSESFSNLPSKFLIGLLLGNCLLYITAFIFPYGIVFNAFLIFIIIVVLALWKSDKRFVLAFATSDITEPILIVLGSIIVTIWCSDLLKPIQLTGEYLSLYAWGDIFGQISFINIFARAPSLLDQADVWSSEIALRPYHYASYFWPSFLTSFAKISSYKALAGFLVPVGLLALCFSAYLFATSIFGAWAGLFAALMLMLLPDPFQQGFGNLFLGQFHWLIQASPAMPYGVACAAIVFVCIFLAYQTQQWRFVLAAYGFTLVTLVYKAQIFVAISFPALILPILLMRKMKTIPKIALIALLVMIYFAALHIANGVPGVAPMRLNGTGFIPYTQWLNNIQSAGLIKDLITNPVVLSHRSLKVSAYIFLVLMTSLGWALVGYLVLLKFLIARLGWFVAFFPILVIAIYLLMALGLALNDADVGVGEELQHRPFVWAYFVVSIWVIAGTYFVILGKKPPFSWAGKIGIFTLLGILFLVPLHYSEGIQGHTKSSLLKVPICQNQVARFLNSHSDSNEIFQESRGDSSMVLTAFSQRQEFAINFLGIKLPKSIQKRVHEVQSIQDKADPDSVLQYMRQKKIKYFVVNPQDHLAWEPALHSQKVFECGGYRIFDMR